MPATVTVAAGGSAATFIIATKRVTKGTTVGIVATVGNATAGWQFTIIP